MRMRSADAEGMIVRPDLALRTPHSALRTRVMEVLDRLLRLSPRISRMA